jgi:hypothetical protein
MVEKWIMHKVGREKSGRRVEGSTETPELKKM